MINKLLKGIIAINILFVVMLPFHYVFYKGNYGIIPKYQLTFRYTLITTDEVESIIKKYNDANLFEKSTINNDPVMQILKEKGIIIEDKKTTEDNK